uniref:Uncharacterized protein n=1 Tax=Ceratitis capitata TaxID=7213 RepID=W8C4K3_CERCA
MLLHCRAPFCNISQENGNADITAGIAAMTATTSHDQITTNDTTTTAIDTAIPQQQQHQHQQQNDATIESKEFATSNRCATSTSHNTPILDLSAASGGQATASCAERPKRSLGFSIAEIMSR